MYMWTVWCTRPTNTQKVAISEETGFLWIYQKSHFLKTENRFWKLYKASSWDQRMCLFECWPLLLYTTEQVKSILQPEMFTHFHTSGLNAKILNILIAQYSWENNSPKNVIKSLYWWFNSTENFEIIGLFVFSTQSHEEMHIHFPHCRHCF